MKVRQPPPKDTRAEVYGHRGLGANGAKPQNTIPAFEQALRTGADGIETDLRLANDGKTIFLAHDAEVKSAGGAEVSMHHTAPEQLKATVTKGADGSTAPLATLDDLLTMLEKPEFAGKKAIFELKAPPDELGDKGDYARRLAAAMLEAMERHPGVGDRLMVSSFDPDLLRAAQDAAPQLPRYLLTTPKLPLGVQLARAKDVELTGVHAGMEKGLLRFPPSDGALRKLEQKFDGHVGTWTVNSPEAAVHQVANGVEQVLTDEPAAVREALSKSGFDHD